MAPKLILEHALQVAAQTPDGVQGRCACNHSTAPLREVPGLAWQRLLRAAGSAHAAISRQSAGRSRRVSCAIRRLPATRPVASFGAIVRGGVASLQRPCMRDDLHGDPDHRQPHRAAHDPEPPGACGKERSPDQPVEHHQDEADAAHDPRTSRAGTSGISGVRGSSRHAARVGYGNEKTATRAVFEGAE